MQNYSKIQKFISFLLIFSILFSFTINITFFSFLKTIFASDITRYNIVSILVQEDIYNDIKYEINRYAKDIQGVLEDTKVIIIPTPSDINPFNIASLNEKLYFEGYNGILGLTGESSLKGTIIVGDLPLPIVENNGSYEKTVFPYVDFEDKLYIYDNTNKKYILNKEVVKNPKAEIWHSFISPNTKNKQEDIKYIKDFFDKTHDFYTGVGNFKNSAGITNGKQKEDLIAKYEPYVFYFDQIRESKAVNYLNYKAYESYIENIEDITYNRFYKELVEKLSEKYFKSQSNQIGDILNLDLPSDIKNELQKTTLGLSTKGVPDIQLRSIIQNTTKRFLEVFNSSSLGEFRKDVHNAGRYNKEGDKVNIDLIPYLISSIDTLSHSILKNVNTELENKIDNLVKNGLSRDIAIIDNFVLGNETYTNFLYGNQAKDIPSAINCSIYRGSTYNSGNLVESNRGFNINNIQPDLSKCNLAQTNGYWGGNSPINIDTNSINNGIWKLTGNDLKKSITPLFDVLGSVKVTDLTKTPSPLMCLDNNLLLTKKYVQGEFGPELVYSVPINGQQAINWGCNTINKNFNYPYNFDYTYKNFPPIPPGNCERGYLNLDGKTIKSYSNDDCETYFDAEGNVTGTQSHSTKIYNFKKIKSWIEHKFPSSKELSGQVNYMISPNLPVDRDRYIDFIRADNTYGKINYPYLFRLDLGDDENFNLNKVKQVLKKYLDDKSAEINAIINLKSPSKLSGIDQVIYNLLKTGPYPLPNIDLYKELENKPNKEVDILGEKKIISYIDSLAFSIYWHNLNSVSAKYKFIIENYLSDQFGGNDFNFFLPKNKKQYEISYLGAPGDPKNMYIKLDPEEKGENPYAKIIADNSVLNSMLSGVGTQDQNDDSSKFKCAPPEGVPIWKWIPAIICRLSDMLPPKISIGPGDCGGSFLSLDSSKESCLCENSDDNKNGINDYLEKELSDGTLSLKSDQENYYYNKTGIIQATILNKDGNIIIFDNSSSVDFRLSKVVVPIDNKKSFNELNSKIIFDKNNIEKSSLNDENARKEVEKYINFKDLTIRLKNGKAQYNFSTKSNDADIWIEVLLKLKDQKGKTVIDKKQEIKISIRGDLTYLFSNKLSNFNQNLVLDSGLNSVEASNSNNVFLISDEKLNSLKNNLQNLNSISSSKEKLFFTLFSKDKAGNNVKLNIPINLKIFDSKGKIIKENNLLNLENIISLGAFKEAGNYTIQIKDRIGNIIKKDFVVLPKEAKKIVSNLSTNLIEKGGVITTNVFSIYDEFDNITAGEFYDVEVLIDGNSVVFEDGSKTKNFRVFQGYMPFRLKSTGNTGTSNINFKLKKGEISIMQRTKKISVIDKIDFDILGDFSNLKVGYNKYNYEIKIKNNSEIDDFHARAYLITNNIYLKTETPYIDIKNNYGTGSFSTKIKSGQKIKLEFKIDGVKDSVYKEIDIKPDLPLKIDLTLSKSKIEASPNATSTLQVELKDRYNNVVWTDNSTIIDLTIDSKYNHIIKQNKKTSQVSAGKTSFILNGTDIPGTAYFKVSSNPSLSNNKIEIKSNSNNLIISGIGENAGKIETFYFWNKRKIDGNKYNAIYTTLLGSNYADITVKDNLANSIIFDKNNRALSVTSLLNSPLNHYEVLNIKPNGNIKLSIKSSDLLQDISSFVDISGDKNIEVSFYNNTFSSIVSKVFLNIKNPIISICKNTDLLSCFNKEKTSIILKNLDNSYQATLSERTNLKLVKDGQTLLEIDKDGKIIQKVSYLVFEISDKYENGFILNLKVNGKIIGNLGINFIDSKINISRDLNNIIALKNSQNNGGIIIYLDSRDYYYKENYLGASTKDDFGYTISYNDPFGNNKKLNNFSTSFDFGYENFLSKQGLGWFGENKILLSFAAGKTVGEATKDYQSFSMINIGDPVVSLKPIKQKLPGTKTDRKFDRTIGTLISKDENNLSYSVFNYNNDDYLDIVILKRGGYIELLEGTKVFGEFINRGNIVHIADYGQDITIETGDFTGDKYDDIVILNKNRNPILINNNKKDFLRINLGLGLKGIISQIISFDMDLDKKHDLVVLDDAGDLHIFYGTNNAGKFEKKLIDSGLGIKLSSKPRNDNGALYFSGLYQLPQNILENKLLNPSVDEKDDFNEAFVDKLIFTQMSYGVIEGENKVDDILKNLPDLSTMITGGVSVDHNDITKFLSGDLEKLNPNLNNYSSPNTKKTTTFIKSEYSEFEGLKVEKKFSDLNGEPLKSGDRVKLEISIKNISSNTKTNIAYVEKIPKPFKISSNPDYKLNIGGQNIFNSGIVIKSSPSLEYNFLIDSYKIGNNEYSISLKPNEELKLELMLDTIAFKYGHIEAGFFDEQTPHGDIIFKSKNENCGKPYDLYKSISFRTYEKIKKEPVCEDNPPSLIKENAIDENPKNGVPDYIDRLIDSGNGVSQDLEMYAKDKLSDLYKDTDKDGIPDREDLSPSFNDDKDFMNSLESINENIDEILAGIDTILAGLSCGFGGPGCISTPLNWAPLAPGNDPTLFGIPIGDGLNIGEGLPIMSALNWKRIGKFCVPMTWPPARGLPGCFGSGAGGRLGIMSPTNFVRLFVTPTLTGAFGIAVCFGAPPILAGQSNPKTFHPFIPGGNCIVASIPIGCKNDGSDGEIYNMGSPNNNILNGNCSGDDNLGKTPYLGDSAKDYLNYKKTGNKTSSLKNKLKDALSTVAKPGGKWSLPNEPLLNIGSGEDFSLELDFGALKDGNFEDVIKIQMTRISDFPDFIMDWVTRQIEEIANKLTDFPTLYVILPDFDGVFDSGWGDFSNNLKKAFDDGQNKAKQEQDKIQSQIDAEKSSKKEGTDAYLSQLEILKLQAKKDIGSNQTISGIKQTFEFLSNLPMINITKEKVDLNIPWIDKASIDKAIADFEITKKQRQQELNRAKSVWFNTSSYSCVGTPSDPEGCKIILDAENLINSIDKNIEILKSYKKLPEDIFKMLKIKEVRLEQILCNIESISKILGGRIGDNGKRFKAWVELYVLIKAILKSWQLLIDIFLDYEAECHQCKNERYDLLYYVWKIISAIMPKIPVIRFPKWPDIYLDLHNIRVGLNIAIPEREFNLRPILLPTLPNLYLPDTPNITVSLPSLPILPEVQLPELPELPSLPKIELPDLPPPPKLPKLFGSIEAFLKILKIITKVMCILKTSPFVPEWRAGDQIAFISERGGYLSFDFLDISLPQFSFPFVDAIKITTWVNLEFEVEFLVEMARQTAIPLNVFTNNIVNMLNIGIGDLDFRDSVPSDINIDLGNEGAYLNKSLNNKKITLLELSSLIALNILKLHSNIKKESNISLSNKDFKDYIKTQFKDVDLYKKDNTSKLSKIWENALNYSFYKEDKLIDELLKNNENKWNELRDIIIEEKQKNNDLMNNLDSILYKKDYNTLISNNKNENDYNTRLQEYNAKTIKSITSLFKEDNEVPEIRNSSKEIINKVNNSLNNFSSISNKKVNSNKKDLVSFVPNLSNSIVSDLTSSTAKTSLLGLSLENKNTKTSCENTTGYSYKYKGIYIIEEFLGKKVSYLLFDYLDELNGKEISKEFDFDYDKDDDIIYMVGNEIYIKENLINKKTNKSYYSGNPIFLDKNDNVFYNNSVFYEAINGFKESVVDNNYINLKFLDSTNKDISNYRIEFFHIVDKFSDVANGFLSSYIPDKVKRHIIDAFRDIDDITINSQNEIYTSRNNLAYIRSIGNLNGVSLKTKSLINLQDDIKNNAEVIVNQGTKLYRAGNDVKIVYYLYKDKDKELKMKDLIIKKHTNISFKEDIVILSLDQELYIESSKYDYLYGNQILNYIGKPLFPGTEIEYKENELSYRNPPSYIVINYFDGSKAEIDFKESIYYKIYDLGTKKDSYLIRVKKENDYYYAKIRSFSKNIFGTYSNQILLSPQLYRDKNLPEINLSSIKVPVYQKRTIDMSEYIFEDSGIKNIKDIFIDFDLTKDSNGDGNIYNDKDFSLNKENTKINIRIQNQKIYFDIGPFEELINKKIRVHLIDTNNNIGYKDINFTIYSPNPEINNIKDDVIYGKIDEDLINEPISFYKIRGGSIEKLKNNKGFDKALTLDGGVYQFNLVNNKNSGLNFVYSGSSLEPIILFKIDEKTGKINISPITKTTQNLDIRVYSSNHINNENAYPKIIVTKDNKPIYYQYLSTPNIGRVNIVNTFENINKIGVYYLHLDNTTFDYYSFPLNIPYNPGDLFIYSKNDLNKTPIISIFKDGKININNENYYLEYDSYGNYVVFNIKRIGIEASVGKVMIIPEENYIMK